MSAEVNRRDFVNSAIGAVVFAGAAMPAFADGAVSTATVQRARGIYGTRIEELSGAVANADFAAVADELNAFKLFSSGAYAKNGPIDKENKKQINAAIANIETAIKKKDAALLKSAYTTVMEVGELGQKDFANEGKDRAYSQGYSSDFDWKKGTKVGTIYVR